MLLNRIESSVLDAEAILQKKDVYGQRYQVDIEIRGVEEDRKETVRTGWIVKPNSNVAWLTTLYVRKRKWISPNYLIL